ncbi:hypothetical protein BU24DRAFT_138723 [Aaosphaeria arxii CBS 175.79]|uniref:N-acetyltransferase domain-containing protein n=1 Tax=Aaosphaeria arxii CBS 175.79 TaxID=1450172 RepID=A0A6A5X5L4_9PLEO|nr:uncharacterized protein BU24DRAFT_138723 [Aaosphaeria arxii CBS 175.79]KAF2008285.1 hypothetical protein BU24DRAFT_138723 [Aaosphaeria arxii CBS 175.79]
MTVTIAPASQEDIREVLRVMFKAYEGKDAYINACFPRGLTDEGLEINYQRLLFLTKIVPEIYWEKATDDESGKIIGGTMWALHKDAKPTKAPLDGPEGTWENQTEKEYGQALFSSGGEDDESYWAQNGLPILSECSLFFVVAFY